MKRVETKKIYNGNKLVIVNVNKNTEYAARYSDIREVKRQLIALYGEEEVERETDPKKLERKWERKYDYKPTTVYEMEDANDKQINFFKTTHPKTGEMRLCIRNEDKMHEIWLTPSMIEKFMENVVEKEFIPSKPNIEITNRKKWIISIMEEKYGFRLLRRIVNREIKITTNEFSEIFHVNLATAIKHLNKFEKMGLFNTRKANHGEKIYRAWLKPEELAKLLRNNFSSKEGEK